MSTYSILITLGFFIAAGIAITLLIQIIQMRMKYVPLDEVHLELERLRQKKVIAERDFAKFKEDSEHGIKSSIDKLSSLKVSMDTEIRELNKEKGDLSKVVKELDDKVALSEGALYKPEYKFDASEKYKRALDSNYELQDHLIKSNNAAKCDAHWSVGGSEKEGAKMAKQYQRLMLRAFNGECDAAIAKVTWDNVVKMEDRIRKAQHTANELGKTMQVVLTDDYLDAKIAELKLSFEYEEKKHAEREEQRQIREHMREDEKARRELERHKEDAEAEEARYKRALEKATEEAKNATGAKMEHLNSKVAELQEQLRQAQEMKERAISRAQMTRAGYVYIISNIGSFGENVYKVGMTRRLDPQDRIDELGNASVPFPFDVHAMIFSEDAPTLENDLHTLLGDRRVNLVNHHKEFFLAELDAIAQHAKQKGHEMEITLAAEAQEYRKTKALRAANVKSLNGKDINSHAPTK